MNCGACGHNESLHPANGPCSHAAYLAPGFAAQDGTAPRIVCQCPALRGAGALAVTVPMRAVPSAECDRSTNVGPWLVPLGSMGAVVENASGYVRLGFAKNETGSVDAFWMAFSPQQARLIARNLQVIADEAERSLPRVDVALSNLPYQD